MGHNLFLCPWTGFWKYLACNSCFFYCVVNSIIPSISLPVCVGKRCLQAWRFTNSPPNSFPLGADNIFPTAPAPFRLILPF